MNFHPVEIKHVSISSIRICYVFSNTPNVLKKCTLEGIKLLCLDLIRFRYRHVVFLQIRKSNVKIQAVDKQGKPLANAKISIQQKSPTFPFGCSLTKYVLKNTAYQNWFLSRFTVATFGDEMKWYSTENTQGHEDYSMADAMLQFTKQHNIAVRGHNVFWDDPFYQLGWVKSLSPQQLASATQKRLNSVMNKYKGQLIGWDVVNENLHFNFFESKMGANASALFYNWAIRADAATTLFLNEYNTIEESADEATTPAKYLRKLKEMRTFPGNERGRFAIGLESHFTTPNIPYIRSSIDTLAAAGVPIWITELDVANGPKQVRNKGDHIVCLKTFSR